MSTRKAFVFSFVDRYAGLAVHVVSAMVIARLLSPNEIGVYSLTMVLVGFIATFRDLGAGQYLVQKKNLTTDDVRATWAVQLGLGIIFASIIGVASIPVSHFYAEPRMTTIMLVLAVNVFVSRERSRSLRATRKLFAFSILYLFGLFATLLAEVVVRDIAPLIG